MKSILWQATLAVLLLYTPSVVRAQCSAATTKTISYDTTVYGYGNAEHAFTFPKFNAALGTLLEVNIAPEITLNYSFQLENKELIPISNYRVKTYRDDEISSASLLTPLTNNYQKTYGPYLLLAADGLLGAGLDFFSQPLTYVMNHVKVNYTVYNVADFIGSGTVKFDYTSTTSSAVLGSINNLFNGSAVDTIGFKITYKYCQVTMLPANITTFTARKGLDAMVDLKWITQNETNTRKYELQKSNDGLSYTAVAQFAAKAGAAETGTYTHQYRFQTSDTRKVIFRVQQTDKDGTVKYSPLRIVDADNAADNRLLIYPNPVSSAATTLMFSNTIRGSWQVCIYDVSGNIIQRYQFNNALTGKINADATLKRGIYMVKAINILTQEILTSRLAVQ